MTLASIPKNVHRVERFLMKANAVLKINDERFSTLLVVVTEAVNNAIIHGNGGDPARKVLVFYRVTKTEAVISVVDEGKGFDVAAVPDPLLPENRRRDHGRGIFLIRHYLDEVSFNKAGNRIMGRKQQRRQ